MWYKEQTQIAIFPRIFKGIKVGYKGQYSFKFQLVHQSQNGTRISAYPYIFKPPLPNQKGRTKEQKQHKTASTKIQNNQGFFETSSFKITFENHVQYLNDMCIFKLEYKLKKGNKGKTYILLHLQSHRRNIAQNPNNANILQLKQTIKTVYTKKIFLNRTTLDFNKFTEVEIQDNDYFSTLLIYIGSVHLGWKIRNNKMSLCQFLSQDNKDKKKMLQTQKQYLQSQYSVGKCIRQVTKQYMDTFEQFYKRTVKKSMDQLLRLNKVYQQINVYTYYPQATIDILKQFNFHETIRNFELSQENIADYFECENINCLYFAIHHENSMLVDNIKTLWQKILRIIKMIRPEDFERVCLEQTKKDEQKWRNNCIKYIFNKGSKLDDAFEKQKIGKAKQKLIQNTIKSSLLQHSKSSSIIKTQTVISRLEEALQSRKRYSFLNLSKSIPEIRETQIQNFKNWRKGYLQNLNIYYQQDINHPFLLIENFSEGKIQSKLKNGINRASLVVFIHGFKGSEFDLERASEYLLKHNENIEVLRIRTLQSDLDESIQEMAKRVATQINKYILYSLNKINSISIVGYSLGGILGRAALPYLQNYKTMMNIFVSFSSPHLGTYSSENSLVKAGIWYMIKFTKARVIQQLNTCRDLKTSTKSYMKKLSQQNQIEWFNKIVLVSCQEDEFVPHLSSRVEEQLGVIKSQISGRKLTESNENSCTNKKSKKLNQQILQMSYNFRSHAKRIERVEVWFDNQNKKGTIDKLTGRESHIQFLDNCRFLKWFFFLYGKQF